MTLQIIPWDGTPVIAPGAYSHVPIDVYHTSWTAEPSISSSGLRTIFSESPAHYWDKSPYNPNREEKAQTEAMILGRAAHHLLLGEADFASQFAIRPEKYPDPKGGADKPWSGNATWCREWLAFKAEQGLTVVTQAQVEKIKGIAAQLSGHPMVRAGALNGHIEVSFLWRDEETGVLVRARPDALPTDSMDFSDLKVTADVSDEAIVKSLEKFGYPQQAALVGDACKAIIKREMSSFSLICAESTRPHCIRAKTIHASDIYLGERANRIALRMFKHGIETGEWPGPGGVETDAQVVGMTDWARKRVEAKLALLEAVR